MSVPTTGAPAIPAPGFADPARDAQRVFRALLDALAHPARSYPLTVAVPAPTPLGSGLGAVALTLLDEDCTVWLDAALSSSVEASSWLAFHTGARIVADAASARFLLVTDPAVLPPLELLEVGSDEAPHLYATVVLATAAEGGERYIARGPGIETAAEFSAPWAWPGFEADWRRNTAMFPRGIDLVLVSGGGVAALPRTTTIAAAGDE